MRVPGGPRPSFFEESSMASAPRDDHDQRLKVLLKEFFEAFFQCFFGEWADRFDYHDIEWLDKELFLAPPQGERRQLDLVARLKLRPGYPPPCEGMTELVALVHLEVDAGTSTVVFGRRMYEYYVHLRRDTGLPVYPIALFLRLGLDGTGWETYEEFFWGQCVLRFQYAYIGLPALDAEEYATGENLLGVALSTLMKQRPERRVELVAEGLKRIAGSGQNDYRRFLLAECLEAYAELDEPERQRLERLLGVGTFREVEPLMKTTYERGIEQGVERGFQQGQLWLTLRQLEAKFGPLSADVKEDVESLAPESLARLQLELLTATTLAQLGLEPRAASDRTAGS